MDSAPPDAAVAPRIAVQQVSRRPGSETGQWIVRWRIENLGPGLLTLETAWLPHGQFRGERTVLRPSPTLDAGQATELELRVHWDEPAGTIVENAFVVLTMRWRHAPWRMLTRVTVGVDAASGPDARTQNTTSQPIGFSQASSSSIE